MTDTGYQYALKCAHQFGAEAAADGKKHISSDDREDIGHYYGIEWREIPTEHRKELMRAFYGGIVAEHAAAEAIENMLRKREEQE